MISQILSQSIRQIGRQLSDGHISARALTEAYLARIDSHDSLLKSYITLTADSAIAQADETDKRAIRLSSLDGIPIAVKDNIDVAEVVTSNGFGPRSGVTADTDAEVVRRLRKAGAIILGKLNMDEGALGATTDNRHYGRTENPWRKGLTAGGSAGGAAAAVAARLCTAALGTDTLGSIRIPAAYCGVCGFKPTFGLISTQGVKPLYHQLDHVGPLCRSIGDMASVMEVIVDHDAGSLNSEAATVQNSAWQIEEIELSEVKAGIFTDYDGVDTEIRQTYESAVHKLRLSGAQIIMLNLSDFKPAATRSAGFLLVKAKTSEFLGDDLIKYPEVYSTRFRNFMERGPYINVDKVNEAKMQVRKASQSISTALEQVDVIVLPTTPQTAFPFVSKIPVNQADFTALANIAGCPALTIPYGLSSKGLPIGVQIIASQHADKILLRIGMAMESAANFNLPSLPENGFDASL